MKFARSGIGRWSVGWMFEYFSALLPVHRVYETKLLVAFHHPKPAYPIHILIVPKKSLRDLIGLADQPDHYRFELTDDLLGCVRELVSNMNLKDVGYRLIVNGGGYQEVGELHFHLVSGEDSTRKE